MCVCDLGRVGEGHINYWTEFNGPFAITGHFKLHPASGVERINTLGILALHQFPVVSRWMLLCLNIIIKRRRWTIDKKQRKAFHFLNIVLFFCRNLSSSWNA
jgi:hypothetical protein